jgi:hypothetical protein
MQKKAASISKPKRDRTKENLTKNIKTLMKNSNKLRKYGADAYLLVHWEGQYWEYTSFVSRPPTIDELVSKNPREIIATSNNTKRRCYPKPVQKTPANYNGKANNLHSAVDSNVV